MMDFHDLVEQARTCRRFYESEPLPEGLLEWLVDCARLSPCAMNAQALRFALVQTPEACASVFPALKLAGAIPHGGPLPGEHPTGYIVFIGETGERSRLNAIDMGVAAQTMQLGAMSRKIGCCIVLSFDPRVVRDVLELPENLEPLLVLAFGVPKEVRHVVPMPADGSCKYWRDSEQTHYVPKRSLDALIIRRK